MGKRDITNPEDVSILSSGVRIEGKLISDGNVRIDGQIIGDVTVQGNLTLGETSKLKGNIKATNISISGTVEGTITAGEKLIIESKSRLTGDIISKILVIEEGAKFEGNSNMSSNPSQSMAQGK
ncbi:MAG: polymer-forming cytoskeletal protein [Bacteroidetes bacterium]|nr:polymer-forming cytoskeletal protein [Bacteroidota bacterium]